MVWYFTYKQAVVRCRDVIFQEQIILTNVKLVNEINKKLASSYNKYGGSHTWPRKCVVAYINIYFNLVIFQARCNLWKVIVTACHRCLCRDIGKQSCFNMKKAIRITDIIMKAQKWNVLSIEKHKGPINRRAHDTSAWRRERSEISPAYSSRNDTRYFHDGRKYSYSYFMLMRRNSHDVSYSREWCCH